MKKLHLICNSHIDPVWMWDWEEGLGEAVSTFYQTEQFCREYDYVFNHNEAVLYEFIQEKDPELFAHIKEQVKAGKWHIMGGWYLQPDCNLPSGEAFVRQIGLGRKYFWENFGARPTTAINFDSFGHSVGLVQILKKCGFDSYLCCRPMPQLMELPARDFWWIGKDGSRVKVTRTEDENLYCSGYGEALSQIQKKASFYGADETGVALWGVGNHGGVPSRKDIEDVNRYIEDSETEVVHSTPEEYFAEIEPTAEYRGSLQPCLIGAYTSMNRIKQKNIELESRLFTTEKLCAFAELNGLYEKEESVFEQAEKALASLAFHDILSGTCTQEGEKSTLRKADYALELLQREFDKALFAVCAKYAKASKGEFPIFILNTQPYRRTAVCETEFLMQSAIVSDTEQYTVRAFLEGKEIPAQCIKEQSNINYDRRKRIAYRCDLAPLSITRVDFRVEVTEKEHLRETCGEEIVFEDDCKKLRISRKTGLLMSYVVNGKELLSGGAFEPVLFEDNADPWGWYMDAIGKNPQAFQLSECRKGIFEHLVNVNVIEDGPVLTEVESFFEAGSSFVRISYKMYRNLPYTDIGVKVLWNEQQKALKLKVPCAVNGAFFGQIPFGTDEFPKDGKELTAHRFVGLTDGDKAVTIYNNCTYGFSAQGNDLYVTLLRGAAYCAHPIDGQELIKRNIFLPYIEQGEHTFSFRLSYDDRRELENHAQEFVNGTYSLNFFPHGTNETDWKTMVIQNQAVSLSAFYRIPEGYLVRLVNNTQLPEETQMEIGGFKATVSFAPYEVKTFVFDGSSIQEKEEWV